MCKNRNFSTGSIIAVEEKNERLMKEVIEYKQMVKVGFETTVWTICRIAEFALIFGCSIAVTLLVYGAHRRTRAYFHSYGIFCGIHVFAR